MEKRWSKTEVEPHDRFAASEKLQCNKFTRRGGRRCSYLAMGIGLDLIFHGVPFYAALLVS
jgi:hypothetical protein